ncbi:MAG: LppX LprAFG lipoprotein [Chloroflexota bacterium]|jgi:hypothetical protein|nr:LppX LprAFG lipoprotein [Chloroflexota bacterium]
MARLASVLLGAVLLAACGTGTVDPARQLSDSASAMAKVKTVLVDVTFGPGATVQGFVLVSASGRVKRPADSATTGKVKAAGALLEPELITVGGQAYLREAQFLPFHQLTADEAAGYPSAGRLLDTAHGVTAVLPKGKNIKSAGTETVDGHACDKITATYTAADLGNALAPITLTDDVQATLWVDHEGNLLRRVRISGHLFDPSTVSYVDARLHDFNSTVSIAAPG